MTEPPEPRRPEEDGGDETDWAGMEQEAIRDFVADHTPDMQEAIDAARAEYGDEQFDEMVAEVVRRANDPMRYTADLEELAEDEDFEQLGDDVTLDILGSGADVEDGGELTDMLSAWRDDVDSVPPSPGTAPETVQQIHDFTQEIDRATTPPRSTEGSAAPMSTMDDANQVRSLGASAVERATGALNELLGALDGVMDKVQIAAQAPDESTNAAATLLGDGHPGRAIVLDATAAWNNSLDPIREQVQAIRQAVTDAQARAGSVGEAFNSAANTASGGGGS